MECRCVATNVREAVNQRRGAKGVNRRSPPVVIGCQFMRGATFATVRCKRRDGTVSKP